MKISVIIPVYNAEAYISRCIESVIAQTYENWELLLIDDGSKDASLDILKSYAQNDSRIYVFHQENAGAGMARNVGIEHASGDYIVFVDSDDYVEKEYFSLIVEKNTDVVFIDVNQRDEKGTILTVEKLSIYASLCKDDILRNQMTGKMLWGGVRKAVKTAVVKENRVFFSKHKVGEEAIYSFLVLYYAKDFSFINQPVYNYVQRSDSLSHTLIDDPWGDVAANLKDKVLEIGEYGRYANTLNAFIISAAVVSLDKIAKKYPFFVYKEKSREKISLAWNQIDFQYGIDKLHMDKRIKYVMLFFKMRFVLPFFLISVVRKIL